MTNNASNIIGTDEVGVGDYFGPLVAVGVYIPKKNEKEISKFKIRDSKKISDNQIRKLAAGLKPLVIYSRKHLTPEGYNKLNKYFNANELKMFLHLSVINDLEAKKINVKKIIIDEFSSKESIEKYLKKLISNRFFNFKKIKNNLTLEKRAESKYPEIAIASIIARDFFLEFMEKMNKQWNFNFPFGSTYKNISDSVKKFAKKNGRAKLYSVAKIKFKTTEKILGNLNR